MATQTISIPRYQYNTANAYTTLLQAEVARVSSWVKEPEREAKVKSSIVKMISYWTRVYDMVERLKESPVNIPPEKEEALRAKRIYTLDYMRKNIHEIEGMMFAMEDHIPELYQATLGEQLSEELERCRQLLTKAEDLYEEDLDDLYAIRDRLEYARMGIEIIRLEYPHLKDVDLETFESSLRAMDGLLKKVLNGKTQPLPYADKTFWWRQPQQ